MTVSETNCVIGPRPHQAVHGFLCESHFQRFGQNLRDVELEATYLDARPSMQQRMDAGGGSLASERAPARLDVLVHTDHRRGTGMSETDDDANAAGHTLPILDVLHSWARVVREERGLTERATEVRMPDGGPSAWAPSAVTITGERDLLTRHLEWIAAQPWCDEAYTDVRQLLSQLRIANHHQPDRPYSHCPVLVDGESCHGQVWIHDELQPVWRRYTDRCSKTWEQAPGSAVCDTCGANWATDAEKARLRRMIGDAASELARPRTDDGRPMLTAAELVDQGHVSSLVNVRVKAHRLGLVSVDGHYDPEAFGERVCA